MTHEEYQSNNYEKKYYVYLYLRENSSENFAPGAPRYVGKGTKKRAWVKHSSYNQVPQNPLLIQIIPNLTEEEALKLEMELIKKYGRKDIGTGCLYNKTDGGENPPRTTKESAVKTGLKHKELWQNPEWRAKRMEKIQSQEFRDQARQKSTGKKQTQESIDKRKQSQFKPIVSMNVVTLERKEFPSISSACEHFNCSNGAISSILLGNKKSCYGHTFVYAEEVNKLESFSMKRAKQKTNLTPVIATKISTGEEFRFDSITDCRKALNLKAIGDVLSGRQSQTGGYKIKKIS